MNALFSTLLIFAGMVLVGYSGTKLVQYVDKIGDRLSTGKALLGALLLGGVTSLPELTTTIVASAIGNVPLAISNLLGGVAMQTTILAVADLILLKLALTYVSPNPVLIMGGVLLIFQLGFVIICGILGELISFFSIGLWSFLNFSIFILFLFILRNYEGQKRWVATNLPEKETKTNEGSHPTDKYSNRKIILKILLHSLPVVGGGILITYSADALVRITGLSSAFLGASIVALATSIPEITTTFYSIYLGSYTLAISNIFGSNSLMIGIIFVIDIFYQKGLVFNSFTRSMFFMTAIGILVTAAYIWGLLERKNKTVFRMGIDSIVVAVIEILGLIGIFFLK